MGKSLCLVSPDLTKDETPDHVVDLRGIRYLFYWLINRH